MTRKWKTRHLDKVHLTLYFPLCTHTFPLFFRSSSSFTFLLFLWGPFPFAQEVKIINSCTLLYTIADTRCRGVGASMV